MKAAGGTQQQWSRWNQGAEPGLNALCQVANALDSQLHINVHDRRSPKTIVRAESGLPAEVIEAARYFEELDQTYREKLIESVKRLAEAYLLAQARNRATRSK